MTALHSTRWHRVASLTPRLSLQVRVRRLQLRGERWILLADPDSGRSVRLNAAAYALAGRFDGRRSVQQLWERAWADGADAVTQDEVIEMLAQLREAGLVQFDQAADFDMLLPHLEQLSAPRGRRSLLAWRVPLANPSRLLERLQSLQGVLFSRGMFAAWLMAVLLLLMLSLQHAHTLWAHAQLWLDTPRFALLAALLYVPIKALHELAHGLAVRRWGGQVREAGVTLMLLLPVPYVDASAASAFVRRSQRIAVSAAGIMVETALAAVALALWLWLDDGLLRDAAFVTFVVAGVSTVLFNANPLQRLDGYYIASDALELPNLGPRSRAWWLDLMRRRLLDLPRSEAMPVARGEAAWLAVYAPLAWLYALLLSALAVAWLGQVSFVLGLLCAGLLGWQMLLRPALRLGAQLRRAALAQSGTAARWRRLALGTGFVLLVLLAMPWPHRTVAQGVVWPPDLAQLRADEDGVVEAVHAQDGQQMQAGEAVLQLANPALQTALARQEARVTALEASLFDAMPLERSAGGDGRAADVQADLVAARYERDVLQLRVQALTVRARSAGRIALPTAADLPGSHVRRGSLLGQVLTGAPPTVRVALPEALASELRQDASSVGVRLAGSMAAAHQAQLARDGGGAQMQLPCAALSMRHGGDVPTDPRDPLDLKPLAPVVLLDVLLDPDAVGAPARIGERAWVRFDGAAQPLALHAVRALRRASLLRLNPQI